jgi:L-ectoine synthase
MFVRTLSELQAAGRIKSLAGGAARSARFLTAADNMGFSYNDNRASAGTDVVLWYKNHWEANYVVSGRGEITDLATGASWPMETGMLYVVGPNDRHRFRIREDEHLISVFCPPLCGDEGHDKDGSYTASGPVPKTSRRMFMRRADEMRAAGKEMVVANGAARTLRMLTRADDVGFGLSDVHLEPGAETVLWYKHHREANHILASTGEVTDLSTGESWRLDPGVAYNVGPRDRHKLRAITGLHLLSIFSPALQGDEQHDAEGTLAASPPI